MKSGVRAIDFMSTNVITATKDQTIAEIAKVLNKYRIGGLPVINSRGNIVGILTERDIMRKVISIDRKPGRTKVEDVMNKSPVLIHKFEDMNDIAKKMKNHDVTRIPVVDGKKLVGIVTNKDVLEQSPPLIDVILEQAKIKGVEDEMPNALGKCEFCGSNGNLKFHRDLFLCDVCA